MPTKTPTAAKTPSETQTVIQINVYRYKNGVPQFLLLKRIDDDNDHFWQPISQAITDDEAIDQTLQKAADHQAGITQLHYLGKELYSYEWYSRGQRGKDVVFAAEVVHETMIFPDLKRYDTFAWMPYKEALLKLAWDGNKKSLRQLMDHLEENLAHPLAITAEPVPDAEIPYEHRSTKDLSDELMPNYGTDDDDRGRVFPL